MNTATVTSHRPPLRTWLPPYLCLVLIWGSSFLFIKVGVRELHPLHVTLGRVLTGMVTVLAIVAITRVRLPRDWRTWGHLTFIGVVGVAIPFSLLAYGERLISSSLAGIWNATTPLVALPMAVLLIPTERFTVRKVSGVLLGFVGVLVVLGVWRGVGGGQLAGQLMCLGMASCYGIAIPYTRRFLSDLPNSGGKGSGLVVPAGQLITATIAVAIVAGFVAGAPPAPTSLSPEVVACVLALGALGSGIAFVFNFRVIRTAGATTSASVTYLLPVVATMIGVVGLNEDLHWNQPVGALVVLVGIALSQGFLRLPKRRLDSQPQPAVADANT